jgi:hypothetical protein
VANNDGVDVRIPLGTGFEGKSAGHLYILARFPDELLCTPAALRYTLDGALRADVTIGYSDYEGHRYPASVQTPQALAEVTGIAQHKYNIDIFRTVHFPEYGRWAPVGQPGGWYVRWSVEAPGGDHDRLTIKKYVDGNATSVVASYEYVCTDADLGSWTLAVSDATTSLQTETVTWTWNGETLPWKRTRTVQDGLGHVLEKVVTRHDGDQPTGPELRWSTQEVFVDANDPEGSGLVATREYYDEPGAFYDGQLKWQTNPDGSWEGYYYAYNEPELGQTTVSVSRGWLGGEKPSSGDPLAQPSTGIVRVYDPLTPGPSKLAKENEWANGNRIRRTERPWVQGTDVHEKAYWGSGENHCYTTITEYKTIKGEDVVCRVRFPDGRQDEYVDNCDPERPQPTFSFDPSQQPWSPSWTEGGGNGSYSATVVEHLGSSGYVPYKSTKDVTIRDHVGNVVFAATYAYLAAAYATEPHVWTVY